MTHSSPWPPHVLITGCSTGIGRDCAIDLASRGWTVFAGVRRQQDGQELVQTVRGEVRPLILDVTSPDQIDAAVASIQAIVGKHGLAGLINNAGILIPGPLELLPSEQLRQQIDVNVLGSHRITQAVLPLLRIAAGRVIFVGSLSGRVTPPYYGGYAASKHALEAIADAWRNELLPWKIKVSMIQPDSVATALWDKTSHGIAELSERHSESNNVNSAGPESTALVAEYSARLRQVRRSGLANRRTGMPPTVVVAAIRHALTARRPKAHYPVGWRTRMAFWAQAILPTRLMDYVLLQAVSR